MSPFGQGTMICLFQVINQHGLSYWCLHRRTTQACTRLATLAHGTPFQHLLAGNHHSTDAISNVTLVRAPMTGTKRGTEK
jgi:hypothetical protein